MAVLVVETLSVIVKDDEAARNLVDAIEELITEQGVDQKDYHFTWSVDD